MKKSTIMSLQRLTKIKKDIAIADLAFRSHCFSRTEDAWDANKTQLKYELDWLLALPSDIDPVQRLSSWELKLRAGIAHRLDDLRLAQDFLGASQASLKYIKNEELIMNKIYLDFKRK
jgi:hypothetical protein